MTAGRDADELTQDVFVRVWQKLSTFRGESAFGTWLHRLAANVVIERFRTDATRRQRHVEGDEIVDRLPAMRGASGRVTASSVNEGVRITGASGEITSFTVRTYQGSFSSPFKLNGPSRAEVRQGRRNIYPRDWQC